MALNTSRQRPSRAIWVLFLAGPVIWYLHFWLVYLLAEAICEADGFDVRVLALHPLSFVTLATTTIAAGVTLFFTDRAWRRFRRRVDGTEPQVAESERMLAFTGILLGLVFFLSILFVGVPALFLPPC